MCFLQLVTCAEVVSGFVSEESSTGIPTPATIVLSSFFPHTYGGQFDWQTLVFMNMLEAGGTTLPPVKSHVTI